MNHRSTLARRYGSRLLTSFQVWMGIVGHGPSSYRWLSNIQLFSAYRLYYDHPPPVFRTGSWHNAGLMPDCQLLAVSMTNPTVNIGLNSVLRHIRTRWRSLETRPNFSVLQVRLTCYPLLLSDEVYQEVDSLLSRHVPEGVVACRAKT